MESNSDKELLQQVGNVTRHQTDGILSTQVQLMKGGRKQKQWQTKGEGELSVTKGTNPAAKGRADSTGTGTSKKKSLSDQELPHCNGYVMGTALHL